MKTKALTTLLILTLLATVGVKGQSSYTDINGTVTCERCFSPKPDTIPVIAFCIDTATLETKFRKLYALVGWNYPSVNFNGLMIYKVYLMPDRKTKSIYKVIYSISK